MNLEARVDKLERDNKTLKKMLGGVAALALAALIGGTVLGVHAANGTFDNITAKTLYLKDASGKTRMSLEGAKGQLRFTNSSGRGTMCLGSEGTIMLSNSLGLNRIWLYGKNGSFVANSITGNPNISIKGYSPTSHTHGAHKPQAHTHTASSKSARKGSNRHSHTITVNK